MPNFSLSANVTNRLVRYDHITYPGNHPVPRSFVGPLLLAGLSSPLVPFLSNGLQLQIVARAVLGLFNAFSLLSMRRAVNTVYGKTAGNFYVLFQATQFHVMYYASRPLPNMFAFGLSTLALSNLLLVKSTNTKSRRSGRRLRLALYLLTIAGVVLRSELALLLGTETLYILLRHRVSLSSEIVPAGLFGALLGLGLTVPLDSHLWRTWPLWPELSAFWFNTVEGHSADWGTSPFPFYFTSALPRLLLNPLTWTLCIPLALAQPATRRTSVDVLVPALSFVLLYSFLPHKETRFVMYVVPSLTAVASGGASWIYTRRGKSRSYKLLTVALLGSVVVSALASAFLLAISSLNYPGGVAMQRLRDLGGASIAAALKNGVEIDVEAQGRGFRETGGPAAELGGASVRVHVDTLAFHTGAVRFLEVPEEGSGLDDLGSSLRSSFLAPMLGSLPQWWGLNQGSERRPRWIYDKTDSKFYPDLLRDVQFWDQFDYALMEHPELAIGAWEVLETVYGYGRIALLQPGQELIGNEDGLNVLLRNSLGMRVAGWTCDSLKRVERLGRSLTGGRWVGIRMEPKIRIIKRQHGAT
ncbi:MAG: hypothetical protein Q9157_008108 [Trypethelium eluteriae]